MAVEGRDLSRLLLMEGQVEEEGPGAGVEIVAWEEEEEVAVEDEVEGEIAWGVVVVEEV